MVFLTVLAAALGLAMVGAGHALDRQLAGRLTVQVVEADAVARVRETAGIVAALRRLPAVKRVSEVDRAQLERMLRPWLGQEGADPDLPVPAMIDIDLTDGSDAAVARVQAAARRVAPQARVDRHAAWMSPVASFMRVLTWLAAGLVLLMASATAAVVVLAARSGLDTHRDTISVLHMLGSTDVQVARLFQRRIALDTLVGGVIGAVLAIGVVVLVGSRIGTLGSDLLGGVSLDLRGWGLLAVIPLGFALLATLSARSAVLRALKSVL
jgi:cell division transport system permease protein